MKKINDYARGQRDERPWGTWEVLDTGPGFAVKTITVKPGGILSLQMHKHRAENWVVVSGWATITIDRETFDKKSGESVFIPRGAVHRIENKGRVLLVFIEVQTGEKLKEDDIIRLADSYGRGPSTGCE
jgi:mannose-6-phosphate isomerase-like protein (cupin superfamily)